jgi:hypothetical protein
LQETHLEWHSKGCRDDFQKRFVKNFGSARVELSATKDKFETLPFKPGGTAGASLGKCHIALRRLGEMTLAADNGCISHL